MSIEISEIVTYHSPWRRARRYRGEYPPTKLQLQSFDHPAQHLGPTETKMSCQSWSKLCEFGNPWMDQKVGHREIENSRPNLITHTICIYIICEKYRNIFEKRLFSASSMTNPDVFRLNIHFCWLNPHLAFRNPYAYLSIQSKQTSDLSIYLPPYPTLYPTLPFPTLPYPTLPLCLLYLSIYL